jgi:hypothetical protein
MKGSVFIAVSLDGFILVTIPILIGKGIPLFGPLHHDVKLRHLETRQFSNGLIQSTYEVKS